MIEIDGDLKCRSSCLAGPAGISGPQLDEGQPYEANRLRVLGVQRQMLVAMGYVIGFDSVTEIVAGSGQITPLERAHAKEISALCPGVSAYGSAGCAPSLKVRYLPTAADIVRGPSLIRSGSRPLRSPCTVTASSGGHDCSAPLSGNGCPPNPASAPEGETGRAARSAAGTDRYFAVNVGQAVGRVTPGLVYSASCLIRLSPLMGVKASSGGHPQRAESGPIAEPEDFLTGALALERPFGQTRIFRSRQTNRRDLCAQRSLCRGTADERRQAVVCR
jgi:hypothetical protein